MTPCIFQDYESQLSGVKQRIVTYLGSLGGSVNHAMLAGSEEEISRRAIAWYTNQHLRFDMPFFDMKPIIYFGLYFRNFFFMTSFCCVLILQEH